MSKEVGSLQSYVESVLDESDLGYDIENESDILYDERRDIVKLEYDGSVFAESTIYGFEVLVKFLASNYSSIEASGEDIDENIVGRDRPSHIIYTDEERVVVQDIDNEEGWVSSDAVIKLADWN